MLYFKNYRTWQNIFRLFIYHDFVAISIKQPTLNPIGVMAQKGQSFLGMWDESDGTQYSFKL
jgi:hypothetical protein